MSDDVTTQQLDDLRLLALSIPRARTSDGPPPATFYTIRALCGDAKKWTVERRFSEFDELHIELSRTPAHSALLPTLPPKTWFKSFDPEFIEQRRVDLEAYLQACLRSRAITYSRAFLAFLAYEASPASDTIGHGIGGGDIAPATMAIMQGTPALYIASNVTSGGINAGTTVDRVPGAVAPSLFDADRVSTAPSTSSCAQSLLPVITELTGPRIAIVAAPEAVAAAAAVAPLAPRGSCLNGHELLARHERRADCLICHKRLEGGALASVCRRRCPEGRLACAVCRPLLDDVAFASDEAAAVPADVLVAMPSAASTAKPVLTRQGRVLVYLSPSLPSLADSSLHAILKIEFQMSGVHIAAQAATWSVDEVQCRTWTVPVGEAIVRAVYGDATPFGINQTCWAFETDKGTVSPFWDGFGNEHSSRAQQQHDWIGNGFKVFEAPPPGDKSAHSAVKQQLEEVLTARGEKLRLDVTAHLNQVNDQLNHQVALAIAGIDESNHICNILTYAWWARFFADYANYYMPVLACIALMVWICCVAIYSLPKATAFGVMLGVFVPAGCVANSAANRFALSSTGLCHQAVPVYRVFAMSACAGLFIGLLGAGVWLVPYWTMAHQGTLFNVSAVSTEWLDANAAPTAGMYHFTSTTFVNQAKYGVSVTSSSKNYCAAPLVASLLQVRTVFWVTAIGCCDAASSSCWNAHMTPGSVTGAYLIARFTSDLQAGLRLARTAASAKLAADNSTFTVAQLDALPAVFLELNGDPEAKRDSLFTQGMVFVVLLTAFWPILVFVLSVWARSEVCLPVLMHCQPLCTVLVSVVECWKDCRRRCRRGGRMF